MYVRLLAVSILTTTISIDSAQSVVRTTKDEAYGFPSLRTSIGKDGTWVVSVHPVEPVTGLTSDLTPLLELMGDSSFRNEIKLDNNQQDQINVIQQSILEEFDSIARRHNGQKVMDDSGQILLDASGQYLIGTLSQNLTIDIDLAMRRAENEFQSVLSEHQFQLANQYYQRQKLQKLGMLQYLLLPTISQSLDLKVAQQRELSRKWSEILDDVARHLADRRGEIATPESHDAELIRRLACTESLRSLDHGINHLDSAEPSSFRIGRPSIEFRLENGKASAYLPPPNMNQLHPRDSWDETDWLPSNLELLKSTRVREALAMSPDQAQQIQTMYLALESQVEEMIRSLNANPELGQPFGDQLVLQLGNDVENLANEVDTKISELLLPHQQAQLRNEITNLRLLYIGAEKYFAGGYLSNDLGISKQDEERIIGQLNRYRIDPIELERLNHEANLKLIKELNRDQQLALLKITGELKHPGKATPQSMK